MNLKVYGCRGSYPISKSSRYGGNTSCMTLTHGNSLIVLDAGSGLFRLNDELRLKYPDYPKNFPFDINVLISHLHLDHIIGLPGFSPIWCKGSKTRIYTKSRNDKPLALQVFGAFKPPYWPRSMSEVSYAECIENTEPLIINDLTVTTIPLSHADKTIGFKITNGLKTVVYLLDNEISPGAIQDELVEYCHSADLVVFDAAYTPEDYLKKIGWGHSTVQVGVVLADKCKCKKMLFAHFAQEYTDEVLDNLKLVVPDDGRFLFAHEGMEISI